MSNSSASSGLVPGSGKTPVALHELTNPNSHYPHVAVIRNESEFSSSKASDESFEDDEDESEDDDFDSSLSGLYFVSDFF